MMILFELEIMLILFDSATYLYIIKDDGDAIGNDDDRNKKKRERL